VRQAETLAHGERNWEIIIGLVIRAYYACPPVDEVSCGIRLGCARRGQLAGEIIEELGGNSFLVLFSVQLTISGLRLSRECFLEIRSAHEKLFISKSTARWETFSCVGLFGEQKDFLQSGPNGVWLILGSSINWDIDQRARNLYNYNEHSTCAVK